MTVTHDRPDGPMGARRLPVGNRRSIWYREAMVLRGLALLLIGLTAGLTPLAQASPADQTWVGGWYDNADVDDAVVAIVSAVAASDTDPPAGLTAIQIVTDRVVAVEQAPPPSRESARQDSRAPPSV